MSTASAHTSTPAGQAHNLASEPPTGFVALVTARFTFKRTSLTLAAGIAVFALALAGCGGSAGHTSEWTSADVHKLESGMEGQEGVTPALVACVTPIVEARTSPDASSAEGEEVGHEAAVSCEKSVNHITASSSGAEKQFGPACQKQLESAACVEEQEQVASRAEAEGEAKLSEEQKQEQKEYEQQSGSAIDEEP